MRKIFVDFDGTLAYQDGDKYQRQIGKPIWPMIDRVKEWLLNEDCEVVIFTARASSWADETEKEDIENFCLWHFGKKLRITAIKEHNIYQIWDDRAVTIVKNSGVRG